MEDHSDPNFDYSIIDPILTKWVAENGLYLYKEFKDTVVRSVELSRIGGGRKAQIWIEPPKLDGSIPVHIWDFSNPVIDLISTDSLGLSIILGEALRIANSFE